MATPRTLRLPLGVDEYGGASTTSEADQGKEATEQLLFLELTPPGHCTNPWGQGIGLGEEVVFEQPARALVDLRAVVLQKFATLERLERARVFSETFRLAPEAGAEGRYVLSFEWQDLRRSVRRRTVLRLGSAP